MGENDVYLLSKSQSTGQGSGASEREIEGSVSVFELRAREVNRVRGATRWASEER